jgi:hypothetical protein
MRAHSLRAYAGRAAAASAGVRHPGRKGEGKEAVQRLLEKEFRDAIGHAMDDVAVASAPGNFR